MTDTNKQEESAQHSKSDAASQFEMQVRRFFSRSAWPKYSCESKPVNVMLWSNLHAAYGQLCETPEILDSGYAFGYKHVHHFGCGARAGFSTFSRHDMFIPSRIS